MNELIIDCRTEGAQEGINRLLRFKGTHSVEGPFPYRMDATWSQLRYEGDKTEAELDEWLMNANFNKFGPYAVVANTEDGR